MTITFAIALTVVLTLSSAYLLHQWRTGALLAAIDDHKHEGYGKGYDKGYVVGSDDGDETGYARGREDEKAAASDPLRDVLQGVASLWPASRHQGGMEADDWQAIAEEMYEKAIAAL